MRTQIEVRKLFAARQTRNAAVSHTATWYKIKILVKKKFDTISDENWAKNLIVPENFVRQIKFYSTEIEGVMSGRGDHLAAAVTWRRCDIWTLKIIFQKWYEMGQIFNSNLEISKLVN